MPERYEQIRNALIDLSDSFDVLSRQCDFLFHDILYAPEGTGNVLDSWDVNDLELLESHLVESASWQRFKVSASGYMCRRYWSLEDCTWAVWAFELFCTRGWKLLVEISKLSPEHLPERFCADAIRPVNDLNPVENWLALLHEFSFRFPTVDLHGECGSLQIDDLKCITNSIDVNVVSASASFIELLTNTDCVADLSGWDGPLELELPDSDACDQSNADLTVDVPDKFPLSVDIEKETITFNGVVYQLDLQLAAVVQFLIDANGEIRSQSDMKKSMPDYCLDARLDLTIKRNLKTHPSGIGEFIESSRKGFRLKVEALNCLAPEGKQLTN